MIAVVDHRVENTNGGRKRSRARDGIGCRRQTIEVERRRAGDDDGNRPDEQLKGDWCPKIKATGNLDVSTPSQHGVEVDPKHTGLMACTFKGAESDSSIKFKKTKEFQKLQGF